MRMISACSSGLRGGDSPVVPQGMMMSVPASAMKMHQLFQGIGINGEIFS